MLIRSLIINALILPLAFGAAAKTVVVAEVALERDDDISAWIRTELLSARGHEGLDGGTEIRFDAYAASPRAD